MSRSYRKPYESATGNASAKHDKKLAHRGQRSRQNQWLRSLQDFDRELVPHRFECPSNEVWDWGRDGHQLRYPLGRQWFQYQMFLLGLGDEWEVNWRAKYHSSWPPLDYIALHRK